MTLLRIILTALLLISGEMVWWLAASGKVDEIHTHTYKIALQLLAVAVTGHVVTFLLNEANRKREEQKSQDSLRRSILDRLNRIYNEIKRLRREFRAASEKNIDGDPVKISYKVYLEKMESFNTNQLDLEIVEKDIESAQNLFREFSEIQALISDAEEYLNKIVDEFEHKSPNVTGINPSIKIADLPKFAVFLGQYKPSRFRVEFVKTYYKAAEKVRGELMYSGKNISRKKPTSPTKNSNAKGVNPNVRGYEYWPT